MPTRAGKRDAAAAYSALADEMLQPTLKTVSGYDLGRVIGQGHFGTVRIGVHRLTNTRVAIKQLPKDPAPDLLFRELQLHRRLRHPHVVALYEIIATERSIWLVSELCTGGELFDYLVEKGRLALDESRRILGQLVLGVAYLHHNGIAHRDLKLENVLLDGVLNVKVADLGLSREFEQGRLLDTWVGTLGYSAPEVLAGKRYLGHEIDIWSIGVIFHALLTGELPFDDDNDELVKAKILSGEYSPPSWLDEGTYLGTE
ncbi:hypothetical protein OIV83_002799 [Microbotryomycetes sp. JL201]|nr:hypothetical protein OIV83_002799 [Microbotryomycetes sp. JL201]